MKVVGGTDTEKPKSTRSRVANGRAMFSEPVDGRSKEARRFKEVLAGLHSHLADEPTNAEVIIVRNLAVLATWQEKEAAKLVSGDESFDVECYATVSNTVRRLLESLGLQRRAKEVLGIRARYVPQGGNA